MVAARSMAVDWHSDVTGQLLAAAQAGDYLDCHAGTARGELRADDIRRACLAANTRDHARGIRIANARIAGRLDLSATRVIVPVHLMGCDLDTAPVIEGAELHELAVVDGRFADVVPGSVIGASHLPGLLANGVRIRRDLVLSGTTVTGAHTTSASLSRTSSIWLTEAEIGGRFLAVATIIDTDGDRSLQADRTRVAGDVRLIHGFHATGELRLLATQLGGSLDLTAASLEPRNGRALDLAEAVIGGSLFIVDDPDTAARTRITGRVEMNRATVRGRIMVRNADLAAPASGVADHDYNPQDSDDHMFLVAPSLTVHGEFIVEPVTRIEGGLLLRGADLKAGLRLHDVVIDHAGAMALDISQATIGGPVNMRRATISGTVNLARAHVRGRVSLIGTCIDRPGRRFALITVGAQIEGDIELRDMRVRGGAIHMRSATVGGTVNVHGSVLSHPDGRTLNLDHVRVGGNVRLCHGFASSGCVSMNEAVVDGELYCAGGTFDGLDDDRAADPEQRVAAIEVKSSTIRNGITLGWTVRRGAVDFTSTHTTYLADDPDTDWPTWALLSGFEYDRFAPRDRQSGHGVWSAYARANWLSRLESDNPRPWDQVARVLRSHGDNRGADEILIRLRRHRRRHHYREGWTWWRRALDWLQDVTVRYGYRPERALAILLALIALVTLSLLPTSSRADMRTADQNGYVYSPLGPRNPTDKAAPSVAPCGGGEVRCFNPLLYAIDTVVPIIDLHERSTWYPDHDTVGSMLTWWLNLCTILGWISSTIFALSFTRIGRGNR